MKSPFVVAANRSEVAQVDVRMRLLVAVSLGLERGPALVVRTATPEHQLRARGQVIWLELSAHVKPPIDEEVKATDG